MTAPSRLRLETFLPYRLSIASNKVSDLVAEAYDRLFGLSIPEWRVIAVLGEEAPLTQLAIVRRTVMDKMTVSRAVRPLVERGLIDRAPHAGDKRSSLLALSDAGRALYESVSPAALAMETALLEGFSAKEIAALDASLRKLETAVGRLSRKAT
jgi:DNA-binding MarR family transcriptional regulator